ncbi:MAG: M20 family metallopeptidase, partial [Candidatus Dormibacteraceae bacterium]
MTPQELIEQTKRLITIPSTTDNPAALRRAVDFVADIAGSSPNVTIERFESGGKPSFLAYRGKLRPAKFDLLLNAHVDVVPGCPEQFEAFEANGKLYGRGALDMKGTAMALTDGFCELVDVVPYQLGLQLVSDEEIGGYNGAGFQIKQGVRAKFVLIGEYGTHRHAIYPAARGICWVEVAFPGRRTHGGHLWRGSNAVVRASNFIRAVLKHYPIPEEESWVTTASISSLNTPNQTYNQVPDRATLKVDFRFIPNDPAFRNHDSFRAFIAGIDPAAELIRIEAFEPSVNT